MNCLSQGDDAPLGAAIADYGGVIVAGDGEETRAAGVMRVMLGVDGSLQAGWR